jgi:two-component system sensor histidine kinase SenX3
VVALHDATEELRTMKVRREFVTNASHELKSPVASLQALADALVQAAPDDPEAVARFAARMSAEAERLGRLVADLLDLSRLEEAGRTADEPVDLAETLGPVVEAARLDADAKLIDLRLRLEPGVVVRGDPEQLAALTRNLLDNAVRYTPDGGWVQLEVAAAHGEALLVVSDSGIGIPTEAQDRIFERFYRADSARSREHGGTGLGLAIVKHVAELHGGRVEVTSELGRGSTFTVHLPALVDKDERRAVI